MSVVAWDGTHLAADQLACNAGHKYLVTKIRRSVRVPSAVLAVTGDFGPGLIMMDWFDAGAVLAEWPAGQATDHWARLVVATPSGVLSYERFPTAIECPPGPFAFGAGRDFALGAMAHGASAFEAVRYTIALCDSCGGDAVGYRVGDPNA